jgi:hypothetical protein
VDLLDPASTGIFDLVDGKNKFRWVDFVVLDLFP